MTAGVPQRGFLTLAYGERRYLEMAVDMALSLKEHTVHPVAISADERLLELARDQFPGVFDLVTPLPPRFRSGRAFKYGSAEATPFEKTVFVDADCLVLASLDSCFDVLATADFVMLGERLSRSDDRNHHGFSTRWLMDRFGVRSYVKTNSGIFAFRRAAGRAFMEDCLRCYLDELRPALRWHALLGRWLGDEIAFGIEGGRHDVALFGHPGPMLWPDELASLDLDRPPKPLMHLIHPPPPGVLDRLLADARDRRARAGLPDNGGAHWRWEAARFRRAGWWSAVAQGPRSRR